MGVAGAGVAGAGLEVTRALVISQVVLSSGIPQALNGLAWPTGRSDVMGAFRNGALVAAPLPARVLGQ